MGGTGIRKTMSQKEKILNYQCYSAFSRIQIVKFVKIFEKNLAQI